MLLEEDLCFLAKSNITVPLIAIIAYYCLSAVCRVCVHVFNTTSNVGKNNTLREHRLCIKSSKSS